MLASIGVRLQRLVTTVARKQLKSSSSSSSVLGSCRHQSSNVVVEEDDEKVVVVDSKRLDATSRRQADDHTDRHVRSSGKDALPCSGVGTNLKAGAPILREAPEIFLFGRAPPLLWL